MPRPKGSKNKVRIEAPVLTLEEVDSRMAAIEAEIEELSETLKAKKEERKSLVKEKARAEKEAAEKKAEQKKAELLDAVAASGKSIEEILEFLK